MNFRVAALCTFQIFVVYVVEAEEAFVFVAINGSAVCAPRYGFSIES